MMNEKQQISVDSLLALARALSAQYGVEVRVVSGLETASTKVETITLPSGKTRKKYIISIPELHEDKDGNYLPLLRLFIDHEVGHVRFTDWELNPKGIVSKTLHHLWNIFEDNRVEYLMGEYFPGCKINLAEGNRILYSKMLSSWQQVAGAPDNRSPADVLDFVYMYLIGQMLVASGLDDLKSDLEAFVNSHVLLLGGGGRIDKLEAIAREAVEYPGTTSTSLEYAQRVLDIIAVYNNQQPSNKRGGGQNNDQQSDGGLYTEQQYDVAVDSNSVVDKSECLIQRLGAYTSDSGCLGECARWIPKPKSKLILSTVIDFDGCKAVTEVLDGKLRSLLQAYKMNYGATARHGRLAYRQLYRLSLNDDRVFERRVERRQLNTEIVVLCDASGSMATARQGVVAPAVYALISSLRKLSGVTSHAYAFADYWIAPVVTPDAPVTRDKFIYDCNGGTPLGSAIYKVLQKFQSEHEARKFLIIMTDGIAGDPERARSGCELAAKLGVKVLGLNIQHTALRNIIPLDRVVDVDKLEDFPRALFGLLQKHWVGVE